MQSPDANLEGDSRPLPDRIRPLEGAGLINMASDIRAPLDSGPIEPMRGRGLPLMPSVCGACIIAAALLYFAWRTIA